MASSQLNVNNKSNTFSTQEIEGWMEAARNGDIDKLKYYLAEGLEIDRWCKSKNAKGGMTALVLALFYGKLKAAEFLIDSGARKELDYAFTICCEFGYLDTAKKIVSAPELEQKGKKAFNLKNGREYKDWQSQIARSLEWVVFFHAFKELEFVMIDYVISIGGRISLEDLDSIQNVAIEDANKKAADYKTIYNHIKSSLLAIDEMEMLTDGIERVELVKKANKTRDMNQSMLSANFIHKKGSKL